MPTKRTKATRYSHARVTPEAVALYKKCKEAKDKRSDEYRYDSHRLDRLIKNKPWLPSPLDEPWENDPMGRWAEIAPIKEALEEALQMEEKP